MASGDHTQFEKVQMIRGRLLDCIQLAVAEGEKITKDEQHTKFWYGLNKKLREAVEAHYLATHPWYNPRKVIPRSDVAKIIYNIFTHERFDADFKSQKGQEMEEESSGFNKGRQLRELDSGHKHRNRLQHRIWQYIICECKFRLYTDTLEKCSHV